jgi:hypothetical protein
MILQEQDRMKRSTAAFWEYKFSLESGVRSLE